MKSNFYIAIFSIAVLASITIYLVVNKSDEQIMFKQSFGDDASCLNLLVIKLPHAFPEWDYWLNNICNSPQKFEIAYQNLYTTDPIQTLESDCISSNDKQRTFLMPDYNEIISAKQSNC